MLLFLQLFSHSNLNALRISENQLLTCGADGMICHWQIRLPKQGLVQDRTGDALDNEDKDHQNEGKERNR